MPSVSQFKCERILDAIVIRPVDAAPTSWICKSEENTSEASFPSGFYGKGLEHCLDGGVVQCVNMYCCDWSNQKPNGQ